MTWNIKWLLDPDAAARRLGERYRGSAAESLALWAAFTVEGLHYLADVHAALRRPPSVRGFRAGAAYHRADAVLQAHARWAGRCRDGHRPMRRSAGPDALRLSQGAARDGLHDARQNQPLLALAEPSAWIKGVHGDADYQDLWPLREQLVHRYAVRHIALGLPGGDVRVSLHRMSGALIAIDDLVPWCRNLASRHVRAFLDAAERL